MQQVCTHRLHHLKTVAAAQRRAISRHEASDPGWKHAGLCPLEGQLLSFLIDKKPMRVVRGWLSAGHRPGAYASTMGLLLLRDLIAQPLWHVVQVMQSAGTQLHLLKP